MDKPAKVTEAELAVLEALWTAGPATVRQLSTSIYPGGGATLGTLGVAVMGGGVVLPKLKSAIVENSGLAVVAHRCGRINRELRPVEPFLSDGKRESGRDD